jgi:proliferating cell nuclear antigen
LWETIVDGVVDIGMGEAAFEFGPDGFKTVVKDPTNVALIRQRIAPEEFEHYDVDGRFVSGVNGDTFDELLSAIDDVPVEFGWNWETYKWDFQADDVDYDMAGIDPESVNGSPAEVPPLKDELPYVVDVTIPVDKFGRASEIVDMNTSVATFRMGGDDGIFVIEGAGDTDAGKVRVHEDPAFEWNEDPPADEVVCRQSNEYMKEVVGLLDENTVRIVIGPETPYHLWTSRNDGRVDTKILQAPRVDTS